MIAGIVLLLSLFVAPGQVAAAEPASVSISVPATAPFLFTVLHTGDLHSSLEGLGPDRYFTPAPDYDPVRGHFARLATVIRQVRAEKEPSGEPLLLVDSGDALFGTLFHILAPSSSTRSLPEWSFFRNLGYDALGLGNHDFESTERGLLIALGKAASQGFDLPFVCGNLTIPTAPPGSGSEAVLLKSFRETRRVDGKGVRFSRLLVKDLSSAGRRLRIGIIGMVGPNAARLCLANRRFSGFVGFDDQRTALDTSAFHDLVKEQVVELKNGFGCDLIMVLFHGGNPEDLELARAVPEIDLLIAGHTHERYLRQQGKTIIAQIGWGGSWLGGLELSWADGRLTMRNPATPTIQIDDRIPAASDTLAEIDQYKVEIDRLRAGASFTYSTPVFNVSYNFERQPLPGNQAGFLVTSIIRQELNRRIATPVDVYLSAYGMIRSGLHTRSGNPALYQFSDIFRILPLGFDDSLQPGTPVVTFYLRPADLGKLLEAMAGLSGSTIAYEPVPSDRLHFTISEWGIPFVNRVADLQLHDKPLSEKTSLVHVGANEFFARNLAKIKNLSHGLIEVVPRDASGTPIATLNPLPGIREIDLLAAGLRFSQASDSWVAELEASGTPSP